MPIKSEWLDMGSFSFNVQVGYGGHKSASCDGAECLVLDGLQLCKVGRGEKWVPRGGGVL